MNNYSHYAIKTDIKELVFEKIMYQIHIISMRPMGKSTPVSLLSKKVLLP